MDLRFTKTQRKNIQEIKTRLPKTLLKKIYHKLPLKFRHLFSTLVWDFFDRLKKTINPLCPQVFVYHGVEKNSQWPLTFAYAGEPSQFEEYWVQAIFAPGHQKQMMGRHFWHTIVPFLKENSSDCNMLLTETNFLTLPFFSKNPGFNVPRWLDMEIDISLPFEKLLGEERLEIQRKIKKHQLTCEITREPKYFDDFYRRMYLPFIQTRHKNTAIFCTRERVMEILSKGVLVLIKKEGTVIAAAVFDSYHGHGRLRLIGILDGNTEYIQYGCVGALYYFIIIELKKRGHKKIHLGGTRTFLSDGVTKFKKSLKANVIPNDPNTRVWLKLLKNSPGVQNFLVHNPFIFYTDDGSPLRAVFMDSIENYTGHQLKNALRVSACNGIKETNLFIFSDIPTSVDYTGSLPGSSLKIQSAKALFSN